MILPQPLRITLKPGEQKLNIELQIAGQQDQITVDDAAPGRTVSTDANNNASALVLKGDDLQALADNPDDLAADLQALAGPSAGPNGGAIFIDGFSGGQLPSKESIREIRINQNPFSAEYDRLGFGRIEIFTKPGSEKFKGALYCNFADAFWNSRNPYAAQKAPFRLYEYGGSLSGPLGKRASFFTDIRRDAIDNGAIINAITLDPATLAVIRPFTAVQAVPQRRLTISPRLDYQISPNHTLVGRYQFMRVDVQDAGIGSFNLLSRGVHSSNDNQTFQLTETSILGKSTVNETRFQYYRSDGYSLANDLSPSIQVIGSFNGGGAQTGRFLDLSHDYEIQNNTSILHGKHAWRFGVRFRTGDEHNQSPQNFGGTFTFGGGSAPLLDAANQPLPVSVTIDSIERYRRTLLFQRLNFTPGQIRAAGGGATQFSLNAGNPLATGRLTDVGLFVGDDWRVRPNLTVSGGLRYEAQSNISDWSNLAPRLALAWAPRAKSAGAKSKTVLRAGFGMFYDRFPLFSTIYARRYDGVTQQQYVVTNPDFYPSIPDPSSLASLRSTQAIQRISPSLRAPFLMQSALSFEQQLPFNTTMALTYANTHGERILRGQDLNAPLPGTYDPAAPAKAVYPLGKAGPVFTTESTARYNQNQLIANLNTKVNKNVSLFGSYVLNRAMSDSDGQGTFPGKPYTFDGEYGPASTDVRHRVSIGGTLTTKWDIRLNPLFTAQSGPPFDITAGNDLFGTTLFNARPGIGSDPKKPGLIATEYGLLDPNPAPGQALLSRNYGRGPGSIFLNLRLAKTFSFGFGEGHEAPTNIPGGGLQRTGTAGVFTPTASAGGPAKTSRKYNITISMSVRNLLNHNNPGPIIGNITSPLFGHANQAAGSGGAGFSEAANNRRLELQTRFTF